MMSDTRPIGIFDSGLGGLTVVNAIKQKTPNEDIIYVGDTARVPYGNKSTSLIIKYSSQITKFLLEKNAKLIVVACNTASALAIQTLQNKFNIPIIGVINPDLFNLAQYNDWLDLSNEINKIVGEVCKKLLESKL